jgi:hypothetical protein
MQSSSNPLNAEEQRLNMDKYMKIFHVRPRHVNGKLCWVKGLTLLSLQRVTR